MKQISLREFQLHPTQYIKELPLVLTQYNKPVATLSTYTQYQGIQLQKEVATITEKKLDIVMDNTDEELKSKWPTSKFGKPLSGRTAKCDICYELCPVEFAQEHYQKEHGDI